MKTVAGVGKDLAAPPRFTANVQSNAHPSRWDVARDNKLRIHAGGAPLTVVTGFQIVPRDQAIGREAGGLQDILDRPQRSQELPASRFRDGIDERLQNEMSQFQIAPAKPLFAKL